MDGNDVSNLKFSELSTQVPAKNGILFMDKWREGLAEMPPA